MEREKTAGLTGRTGSLCTWDLGLLKARESLVHLPPALITWCKVPQQRVTPCESVPVLCSLESTFLKAKLRLLC